MSRIRYNRPQLVYLDNLRRELGKDAKQRRSEQIGKTTTVVTTQRVSRLSKHFAAIDDLNDAQRDVLGGLIDCYGAYIASLSYEMARIVKKHKGLNKPKKRLPLAKTDLVDAGVALLRQAVEDGLIKKYSAADWLNEFFRLLPESDKESWRLLDEFLVNDCMEIVESGLF